MPTYVNAHVPWFNVNRYVKSNSTQWSESSVTWMLSSVTVPPAAGSLYSIWPGRQSVFRVCSYDVFSIRKTTCALNAFYACKIHAKNALILKKKRYRRVIGRVLRTKDAVWTYSYPVWPVRQRVFSNVQVKLLPSESQVQIGGEWNVRNCCLFEKLAAAGWGSPLRCFTSRVPSFNCVCKSVLMFFTNKHVHFLIVFIPFYFFIISLFSFQFSLVFFIYIFYFFLNLLVSLNVDIISCLYLYFIYLI